jgi:hypothetical protein
LRHGRCPFDALLPEVERVLALIFLLLAFSKCIGVRPTTNIAAIAITANVKKTNVQYYSIVKLTNLLQFNGLVPARGGADLR